MNAKTRVCRHLAAGCADQGIDAGRVAARARRAQLRLYFAVRLDDLSTRCVVHGSGAATFWKAFSDARRHPALAQNPTQHPRFADYPAERIEKKSADRDPSGSRESGE